MKPRKIWANLAVQDISRTDKFYKALGFTPNGEFKEENDLTSFVIGEHGFVVHFFKVEKLKEAMGEVADLTEGNEIILTLWADTKEEADSWAAEVRNAGGHIFDEPKAFGKGYYGFGFADPDGHKWNVFNM